ncbi:trypsin-like peptidase domain-containing protein [Dyadobacter sp. OTU695]|uniref:trypsin-like peptidase domain-containing protein n=1 Tax=Dyadobacter sp. OTU695 TaxID=3043860 RepID=UPI00313B45B5
MKTFLLSCLFFTLALASKAQIMSKWVQPSRIPAGVVISKSMKTFGLAPNERKELLKQDSVEALHDYPRRFGKNFESDIDIIKEAKAQVINGKSIRLYEIESTNAYSINLIFDKIFLSPGAELNIYNHDRSFIYGPVNSENVPSNGIFWTDLIPGNRIVIELTENDKNSGSSIIHISNVIHGYRRAFQQGSDNVPENFGTSLACHRDWTCDGGAWRDEGDAVVMLMLDYATRWCSGALINNQRQDFKPYVLTAFHCLDNDATSGTLSTAERNAVNNWVYRFRYHSPTCSPLADGNCYISFNGANFRAALQATDMTLLELMTQPRINHGVSFAGWDRSGSAATSAVGIHHPDGDVKKISFDNNAVSTNSSSVTWTDGTTSPSNSHWNVGYDNGTTEGGSSGSPLFDQNKRIVGQLHGGPAGCAPIQKRYGRFDKSWSLGTTSDTRLRDWLDPDNTGVTTVNTFFSRISGPTLICSSGNFSVDNLGSGASVSWSSSNTSVLTINSSGTATRPGTAIGTVTISATVPNSCGSRTITKTVTVGPPSFAGFLVNGQSTSNGTGCTNSYIPIAAVPNDPSSTYYWSQSDPNGFIANASQSSTAFTGYNASCYYLNVSISNSCGSRSENLTICLNNCFAKYTVFPNPAKDHITIEFDHIESAESLPDEIILFSEKSTNPVKNVDVQSLYQHNGLKNGKQIEIDAKALPRGTYYLHIKNSRLKENKVDIIRILLE